MLDSWRCNLQRRLQHLLRAVFAKEKSFRLQNFQVSFSSSLCSCREICNIRLGILRYVFNIIKYYCESKSIGKMCDKTSWNTMGDDIVSDVLNFNK